MVLRFFIHAMAIAFLFISCADGERNNPYDPGGNNYREWSFSSSSTAAKNYCVYAELGQCYFGIYTACPGVGGKLADECPYSSSSSNAALSSSGQSSQSNQSSSSTREYDYCVFVSDRMCLTGPMSECPPGGTLSNSCPYGSSSSVAVSSSSSLPSSSSSVSSSSSISKQSSSSSTPPSSSSVAPIVPSSSSVPTQTGIIYGTPVNYGGETYQTVVIGTQTWMAKNLNYKASGSVCYGEGGTVWTGVESITLSPSQIQANCQKYGRLYNWATAMNLPSACNFKTCALQIGAKHRGICPSGWHIPSGADLTTLTNFVGRNIDGKKLKATSGWNDYEVKIDYRYTEVRSGNGTDDYGFAALPGGYGGSDGDSFYGFNNVGNIGSWWNTGYDSDGGALFWVMASSATQIDVEMIQNDDEENTIFFSVRCVRD